MKPHDLTNSLDKGYYYILLYYNIHTYNKMNLQEIVDQVDKIHEQTEDAQDGRAQGGRAQGGRAQDGGAQGGQQSTHLKGEDVFQTIGKTLGNFHEDSRSHPNRKEVGYNMEIEVRMGLICPKEEVPLQRSTASGLASGAIVVEEKDPKNKQFKFESGVSPKDYETIKNDMEKMYGLSGTATKDTVFYITKTDRVVFDETAKKFPYKEVKESLKTVDIRLPSTGYDLRFQTSMEYKPKEEVRGDEHPKKFSQKRTRRRISWESVTDNWNETDWMWKTDLTMVESTDTDANWEVELELKQSVVEKWLDMSDPDEVMTSMISSHLINLLEKINPSEDEPSGTNPEKVDARTVLHESVVDMVLELHRFPVFKKSEFPGAQPVNMSRKDITRVQDSPATYYVAEKSDGVRYLMVSTNNTCVLVNRVNESFSVYGGSFLHKVLGEGTVLDGELIYDSNTSIFVAFDILQYTGTDVMSKDFLYRLAVLRKDVMGKYLDLNSNGEHHLRLDMKTFYPRTKIMDLFRHIRVEGRHRMFKNHKTDGVIFQPNLPYKNNTDVNLLKWKWGDLASIDLEVEIVGNVVELYSIAGGVDNKVKFSNSVHFSKQDKARLVADVEHFKRVAKSTSAIVEMALDPASGMWVYMRMRTDKDKSNFITVVMSTMVELAEGVSEEELKYRMMLGSSSEDDYCKQESVLRKRLVQYSHEKNGKKTKS